MDLGRARAHILGMSILLMYLPITVTQNIYVLHKYRYNTYAYTNTPTIPTCKPVPAETTPHAAATERRVGSANGISAQPPPFSPQYTLLYIRDLCR